MSMRAKFLALSLSLLPIHAQAQHVISPQELDQHSGQHLFDAAYQAYICSMWLRVAGQNNKARFLRWYSTQLMGQDKVRAIAKNWNDVNIPGGAEALIEVEKTAKAERLSEQAAAAFLLDGEQCRKLDAFSDLALR